MMYPLTETDIAEAFLSACRAELHSLKPGNVHIHASGHGMGIEHFERAAVAAAPCIARTGAHVGYRIRTAVEASFQAAGCNTNLGIVLLCVPLAYAAGEYLENGSEQLSQRLAGVLVRLDQDDARETFSAIATANPGGLGEAEHGDVRTEADVTLYQAMNLAKDRDRIALAYVTGYADIFEFSLPLLRQSRKIATKPELAVTTLHMNLLARFPDTHIARKFGPQTAHEIMNEARRRLPLCRPVVRESGISELMQFDAELKSRGLNPGTTADFVVATLFTESLSTQVAATMIV